MAHHIVAMGNTLGIRIIFNDIINKQDFKNLIFALKHLVCLFLIKMKDV